MDIYTAHYRYAGNDRLDITVKSSIYPGNALAPTWEIVRGLQAQKLSQWDYTVKYFSLIIGRMAGFGTEGRIRRAALNNISEYKQVTLVCFCPPFEFCHRVLAARMLENMGYGKYLGERQL